MKLLSLKEVEERLTNLFPDWEEGTLAEQDRNEILDSYRRLFNMIGKLDVKDDI